ncbi:MAG: hypothetical protein Q8P67_21630 [archaeon]|nr:hypothetical protein [archaeon]
MASLRGHIGHQEKDALINAVCQIFAHIPYIDRHVVQEVLDRENWDADAAIDELFTVVSDPVERSVVASVALHHGTITPAVYAYMRPRHELEQIQLQNAAAFPTPPSTQPLLPLGPAASPSDVRQLGLHQDVLQFLQQSQSHSQLDRQRQAEEARRLAYETQARERAAREQATAFLASPQSPGPSSAPLQPAPQSNPQQLEEQRADIFLMAQEAPAESSELSISGADGDHHQHRMPTVAVFFNDQATAAELTDAEYLKGRFLTLSVPESQIRVCDVTKDPEMAAWMNEQLRNSGKAFSNPLVFIHRFPIGNRKDVDELVANNQHTALLQNPGDRVDGAGSADDGSLSVGVFGGLLNVGEALGSGLWSVATAPIALGKWLWGTASPEPETGIDFLVVHQNWYWRNLHRVFRFTEKGILRMHPSHKDVRAQHDYTSIEQVQVVDNHNIRISYKDGSAEDWIRAPQADLIRMLVLFNERSQGTIRIVRVAA